MKQASILVVEDERIVAFGLKQQLEALGYRVTAVVPSGELAIEKASELKPDLVLMDIHLEGAMDGVEAAERIHACLRIPVIFLTAYAEDETLSRAQVSLPFGYLVKPYEVREVHATIQMALVRRAAEVAVEQSEERLQLALDAADLGVWEWDAATGQVTTAGHIDALFGSVAEPVSETHDAFLARVHPEDRRAIERALREALSPGHTLKPRVPLSAPQRPGRLDRGPRPDPLGHRGCRRAPCRRGQGYYRAQADGGAARAGQGGVRNHSRGHFHHG